MVRVWFVYITDIHIQLLTSYTISSAELKINKTQVSMAVRCASSVLLCTLNMLEVKLTIRLSQYVRLTLINKYE